MPEDADDLQQSMHGLSLLHLNCFNSHNNNHAYPHCTTCGCCCPSFPSQTPALPPSTDLHINPLKRRSPEPSTSVVTTTAVTDSAEPIAKKLFQDQRQTHSGQENSTLPGFTKISLPSVPFQFQESSFPVLRRCASDRGVCVLQADSVAEFEEAVTVERTGQCLLVNLKCPCGKGYQILLSSKSCYYKLI